MNSSHPTHNTRQTSNSSHKTTIKPKKSTFLYLPVIFSAATTIMVTVIIYFILSIFFPVSLSLFILISAGLITIGAYMRSIQFKKEVYEITDDRIRYKSGGIFSDSETELIIKNITHVIMNHPFLEYGLLKTGSILIQSAGSGDVEVVIQNIDNPRETYNLIQEKMRKNGFRLNMENLVQEERPSALGVFFEVFKGYIGTIFFGSLYVVLSLDSLPPIGIIILVTLFITFFFLAPQIFKFLDLKKRVYRIYDSTITYYEGFLNKQEAFLPMENLADTTISQSFIDRVFSLYDVVISCQGSNQEIVFKNMKNGPQLEENIDKQVKNLDSLVSKKGREEDKKHAEEVTHGSSNIPHAISKNQITIKIDESIEGIYKMNGKRLFLTNLIFLPGAIIVFPLMMVWIWKAISDAIQASSTTYEIRSRTIREEFAFINKKTKEFSIEKIMGVQIKESILDRWFGTCSIIFWSIGSTETIVFRHVSKTNELVDSIRKKCGFVADEAPIYQMKSQFSIDAMLVSSLPLTIISAIVILVLSIIGATQNSYLFIPVLLIAVLYLASIAYKSTLYEDTKLSINRLFCTLHTGLLIREETLVHLDNIKDITTTQFPFITKGNVQFNVAGEQEVGTGDNISIQSNKFSIGYIENISNQDEIIDIIFHTRPSADKVKDIVSNLDQYKEEAILTSQPSLANSIVWLIILSVVLFPLLLILPVTLFWTIISVRAISFRLESYRAIEKRGVLYKTQTSIISRKIDHINKSQGLFNKVFKNGTVSIYTVGSSHPEIIMENMPNYKEVYDQIHKQYL